MLRRPNCTLPGQGGQPEVTVPKKIKELTLAVFTSLNVNIPVVFQFASKEKIDDDTPGP